jgi:HrpA-like RNA helicase
VDAEQLKNFFTSDKNKDSAVIMSVQGRLYPVDVHYVIGECRCKLLQSVKQLNLAHTHIPKNKHIKKKRGGKNKTKQKT